MFAWCVICLHVDLATRHLHRQMEPQIFPDRQPRNYKHCTNRKYFEHIGVNAWLVRMHHFLSVCQEDVHWTKIQDWEIIHIPSSLVAVNYTPVSLKSKIANPFFTICLSASCKSMAHWQMYSLQRQVAFLSLWIKIMSSFCKGCILIWVSITNY